VTGHLVDPFKLPTEQGVALPTHDIFS